MQTNRYCFFLLPHLELEMVNQLTSWIFKSNAWLFSLGFFLNKYIDFLLFHYDLDSKLYSKLLNIKACLLGSSKVFSFFFFFLFSVGVFFGWGSWGRAGVGAFILL